MKAYDCDRVSDLEGYEFREMYLKNIGYFNNVHDADSKQTDIAS
jgi:hypothetical protein